jgi:hypothetical protein
MIDLQKQTGEIGHAAVMGAPAYEQSGSAFHYTLATPRCCLSIRLALDCKMLTKFSAVT